MRLMPRQHEEERRLIAGLQIPSCLFAAGLPVRVVLLVGGGAGRPQLSFLFLDGFSFDEDTRRTTNRSVRVRYSKVPYLGGPKQR